MSQVAKSHLEIIVAVGENRQRHAAALAATDDPVERAVLEREHSDIINEAVDYRLAMLGLSDEALPENVRGVDRAALGDAYLVVYSSSTVWKSTNASGAPANSSRSHFSAMTWPPWQGRAVRNRHRHAIDQASRR